MFAFGGGEAAEKRCGAAAQKGDSWKREKAGRCECEAAVSERARAVHEAATTTACAHARLIIKPPEHRFPSLVCAPRPRALVGRRSELSWLSGRQAAEGEARRESRGKNARSVAAAG